MIMQKDKDSNVETFLELVENKPENRYVIVMVDMSLLPERKINFIKNRFHII